MEKRSEQVHSRESSATLQLTVSLLYQKPHLGFVKRNKKVIMMKNFDSETYLRDALSINFLQ